MDWGRKWLVDFTAGKTQLISFDCSNNAGAIDLKMDGSPVEEKSYFKMLVLTFSSKLEWDSCIISSKKVGALIRSMKFFSPEVFYISINLPYCHSWNIVVTSGVLPLVATSNC